MDLTRQAPHVHHRQAELRDLANQLRQERHHPSPGWARAARVALGRRLVLAGIALLDGARPPVAAHR